MAERATETVEIVEVSPRDGIQNQPTILSLDTKIALIEKAIAAGARRIEAVSFVNPKRVPQMAGAEELLARLPRGAARYIGLVLNRRGFERARETALDEINFVVVASDTFNLRNQGAPTADTIAVWADIAAEARGAVATSVTIGAAFGCPFEGEVPVDRLLHVVDAVMKHDPHELALADTIGVASPPDITARIGAIRERFPEVPLRLHLHNTRNTGIANAWAAIGAGVRILDSSLAGSGGCPFAPRATGNIATEDLVYMLERADIETGMDLDALCDAARWLEDALGTAMPGMVMKAGGFPRGEAVESADEHDQRRAAQGR